MSRQDLEKFYQELNKDTSFHGVWQEKVAAANDKNSKINLTIELAKNRGFEFSAEELNQLITEEKTFLSDRDKLSDKELESVAGGFVFETIGRGFDGAVNGLMDGLF